MISVALTGNVAAGKSEVAEYWRSLGVPVVSADELARQVVAPGSPGLGEVRAAFGDAVIAEDGSLDRPALRRLVFDDDKARARLEAILHPRIHALRNAWMREQSAGGAALVVAEIPLLFETGLDGAFDIVVFVDAPEEVRLRRLAEHRGISEGEARKIMAAQMPADEKRPRADIILSNDGSRADLRDAAGEALERMRTTAEVDAESDARNSGNKEGQMRLDLHLHTSGSWDCLSDPRAVLERALAKGIDRIAITDHNRLHVALRMAEEYGDRVIPGEEVKTAEGIDVIGLYLSEEIPKGTPAREVIERVRDQGGIPYLPHPYASGKGGGGVYAEELAPLVDVVEVFNARLHPGRLNRPAEELAKRHGSLRGAGSDAHTLGELGGAFVEVPAHENRPGALLRALEEARVEGRTASNLVHLASTWAKVRKRLPGGR